MLGRNRSFPKRELWVEHDGKRIFGMLYTPHASKGPLPAVICSHFFGGTYRNSAEYAEALAERGFVTYAFDYCGGSAGSRSSGKTTECSIMTEKADLDAVLDAIRGLDAVDEQKVFLLGQSQGGAVSAMVAAERGDDVAGLVLCYPAFVIHDHALQRFGRPENVPETFPLWQRLGRIYAVDAMAYDFYKHIGAYGGPVLMFQGDRDGVEPKEYTDRAAACYRNMDYEVVEGAGHGFYGRVQRHVFDRTERFIRLALGEEGPQETESWKTPEQFAKANRKPRRLARTPS